MAMAMAMAMALHSKRYFSPGSKIRKSPYQRRAKRANIERGTRSVPSARLVNFASEARVAFRELGWRTAGVWGAAPSGCRGSAPGRGRSPRIFFEKIGVFGVILALDNIEKQDKTMIQGNRAVDRIFGQGAGHEQSKYAPSPPQAKIFGLFTARKTPRRNLAI